MGSGIFLLLATATFPLPLAIQSSLWGEEMAKSNRESPRNHAKFDEAKFFKYLNENADPSLLQFLRSIDRRACVEASTYLIRYLRRSEEKEILEARRQRGVKIRKAFSATIRALQKASAAYKELAALDLHGAGPLGQPGSRLWPADTPFFGDVLREEEQRLTAFLEDGKKLYNEKRFGVSGNHVWLITLQEFVLAWTERELGQARELRSEHIATMIEAAKVTLGWREDKSETDPELLRKAISNFRNNQANDMFLSRQIIPYAQSRCDVVADGPYLLGIEI
jgi:hypothetical protein